MKISALAKAKRIFHANGNEKKARVAIFLGDKRYCKTKTVTKGKEGICCWYLGTKSCPALS